MNLTRDRSDLHSHHSRFRTGVRQLPMPNPIKRAALHLDGTREAVAPPRALNEAILKCLHRDDPLRHRYLRRRWQAF